VAKQGPARLALMRGLAVVDTWGSTSDERSALYPCDRLVERPDLVLFRAVDVSAPAPLVFRWLCQLRAAPYSYDWIDNRGHRSPRVLNPDLERLEVGQHFMRIFRLASSEEGSSITLDSNASLFGRVVCTYRVTGQAVGTSRMVAKLLVTAPPGLVGLLVRLLLPAGDVIMMRKQLITLKRLAERDAGTTRFG
jgi:hypothetical protein